MLTSLAAGGPRIEEDAWDAACATFGADPAALRNRLVHRRVLAVRDRSLGFADATVPALCWARAR